MGKMTLNINKLILKFVLLIATISVHAEAIDLRTSCNLNTQTIENQEKPNPVKNTSIETAEKPVTKKTSTKSNKLGIFKLLIPGTLR
jgi:hypothetical protein